VRCPGRDLPESDRSAPAQAAGTDRRPRQAAAPRPAQRPDRGAGSARCRPAAGFWRRSPVTTVFVVFLLAVYWVMGSVLPQPRAVAILRVISTNIANMRDHPLVALVGSGLVIAPPLLSISGLLIVGLGLAGCMAWLERRAGAARAVAVFAVGHAGATLLTLPVIEAGIATGHYGADLRTTFDFGVSYGSAATTAAVVAYLPRWARPLWITAGVGYLLSDATWSGCWPDFTTVGHITAVAIGVLAAILLDLNHNSPGRIPPAGTEG
jgi:hypothetical protein